MGGFRILKFSKILKKFEDSKLYCCHRRVLKKFPHFFGAVQIIFEHEMLKRNVNLHFNFSPHTQKPINTAKWQSKWKREGLQQTFPKKPPKSQHICWGYQKQPTPYALFQVQHYVNPPSHSYQRHVSLTRTLLKSVDYCLRGKNPITKNHLRFVFKLTTLSPPHSATSSHIRNKYHTVRKISLNVKKARFSLTTLSHTGKISQLPKLRVTVRSLYNMVYIR